MPVAFRPMLPRLRHPAARLIALVCVIGAVTVPAAIERAGASRVTQTTLDQKIDELTQQLGEVSAQERAQLQDVIVAKAARQTADEKVKVLDVQATKVGEEQVAAEVALGQTAGRLQSIEKGMKIAKSEIERSAAGAQLAAQQLYVQNAVSTATPLEFAVSLDDTNTALSAEHYLSVVQREQRRAVVRRQQAQEELGLQASRLEGEQRQAEVLRDRALAKRRDLDQVRASLSAARGEAIKAEEAESAALALIRTQKAAYEKELAQAKAESDAIAAQLGGGSSGPRPGRLLWPVNGPITSPFGPRPHPIYGIVKVHEGIDIGVGMGTPIKAPAAGTVKSAGWQGGYGNATVIDHGGGMATLYGHQSSFAVRAGQRVNAGDIIGYVGSTGNSTGPHLHFEVRINGRPVNPMGYL